MKIGISKWEVDELIKDLKFLKDNLELARKEVVKTLIDKGGNQAEMYNNMAPQSGLTKSRVIYYTTENSESGYIALTGPNAVYDEFGTGEEGAKDAHPLKGEFGLNPYNSGPEIFYNQFTNRYQWAYSPMAGKPYFTDEGLTSGIPSGKQMYNTSNYIRFIKDSVIEKTYNSAIKKFNK